MATNMKKSKLPTGAIFPERAIDGTGIYDELEPLIDGETMARSYLFGIPLVSPITKERLGPKDLNNFVKRGMARFQLEVKAQVQTKLVRHRMPFDPELYKQYIALEIPFKPIRRVTRVAICSASYAGQIDWGPDDVQYQLPTDDSLTYFPIQNNWQGQTAYGLGAIVTWNGFSYSSLQGANANNQPDTSPAWWSVAQWDGDWSPVTTYGVGAIVTYLAQKYVSQLPSNIGNLPNSSPQFWSVATVKSPIDPRFPSGAEIYNLPLEWLEMGNATRGLLNVVPLGIIFSGGGLGFEAQAGSLTGSALLQVIGAQGWLPAFWTVECETGLMDAEGQVPVIVNEAIGIASALYAIDVLLPLFRVASQSMSVDNLSQSVQDRIIDIMERKQETLEKRYSMIVKHLKTMFGNNFFTSNV
jgi:hypothetical protein